MNKLGKLYLFISEFLGDAVSYFRYCGVSVFQDKNRKLFYKILIEAHALEKGLSLRSPRPHFGKAKIKFLIHALKKYDIAYSPLPAEMTIGLLQTYLSLHTALGEDEPFLQFISDFVVEYRTNNKIVPNGGLREAEHLDYTNVPENARLIVSRHSKRMYENTILDLDLVKQVVSIAQSAPSQCNRQSSKVYFYQNSSDIESLLKLQAGSAGFAQEVNNLFVVTSDLAAWGGAQQRNQPYIDGALFAMNLMLACHALGLATCPLNLAVTRKTEKIIKKVGKISQDERLIMMISVGVPTVPPALKVARSPRRNLNEILSITSSAD